MPEIEAKVPEVETVPEIEARVPAEAESEKKEQEVTSAVAETVPLDTEALPDAVPETKMPETMAALETTPSVLKDIPSSKMQLDAF